MRKISLTKFTYQVDETKILRQGQVPLKGFAGLHVFVVDAPQVVDEVRLQLGQEEPEWVHLESVLQTYFIGNCSKKLDRFSQYRKHIFNSKLVKLFCIIASEKFVCEISTKSLQFSRGDDESKADLSPHWLRTITESEDICKKK